jgi:hypothetical protein
LPCYAHTGRCSSLRSSHKHSNSSSACLFTTRIRRRQTDTWSDSQITQQCVRILYPPADLDSKPHEGGSLFLLKDRLQSCRPTTIAPHLLTFSLVWDEFDIFLVLIHRKAHSNSRLRQSFSSPVLSVEISPLSCDQSRVIVPRTKPNQRVLRLPSRPTVVKIKESCGTLSFALKRICARRGRCFRDCQPICSGSLSCIYREVQHFEIYPESVAN